ncbi:MAG: glycoside hydrolase family 172 protein [Limisphaera sp.]
MKPPRLLALALTGLVFLQTASAAEPPFNGIGVHLGNLFRLSHAQSRSISPENFTGEKGRGGMSIDGPARDAARDLGQGWKISPYVRLAPGTNFVLADIQGPGCIQHIWLTPAPLDRTRFMILRFYWDDEPEPSVEVPLGDFFACGWARYCQINSLAVCVNPGSAFNCYWPMPFRKRARVMLENLNDGPITIYYQIDYVLTDVPEDAAYFHAQFRREDPLKEPGIYTILDGVEGRGHYVGTYLAWEVHSTGWWGEGEVKFYIDGDRDFPTICGTGTEDYFCGSYNFDTVGPDGKRRYTEFSGPYTGLPQVIRPDGLYDSQQRFGLYRWHIPDPIRFQKDLRVTIQALGWRSGGRYLKLRDDIASVAYWYQTEPHKPFPRLPSRDDLELK